MIIGPSWGTQNYFIGASLGHGRNRPFKTYISKPKNGDMVALKAISRLNMECTKQVMWKVV